jgi:flagellar basal body-associated protein FliL
VESIIEKIQVIVRAFLILNLGRNPGSFKYEFTEGILVESNAQQEQKQAGPDTTGFIIAPMTAAAALDTAAFSRVNASEMVPATWEEHARKAWEYYVEEPLVKNCVNSWRTFAVGDEIKIAGDNDKLKSEATDAAYRLNLTQFI